MELDFKKIQKEKVTKVIYTQEKFKKYADSKLLCFFWIKKVCSFMKIIKKNLWERRYTWE